MKGSLQHKPGCFSVQCTTGTIKGRTGYHKHILQPVQEYVVINSIDGCGKVKEYKNSTLPGIKSGKYVIVNFHKGCFC